MCEDVDGLLHVVDYLKTHPRPGIFAREIPGPMDTKFISRNRRMLREWLDRILPPETIRADEEHFERRYGLRYAEPHILLRFLDTDIERACGCPWPELSLPLGSLARMPMRVKRVIVVENKVNLLTLPGVRDTAALGGLGNGVTDLRYVPWLASCELWYWGDVDADGLAILSRLRSAFPQTRSLLMDGDTVRRWRELAVSGSDRAATLPPGLRSAEECAFNACVRHNLRIEQERLPQAAITDALVAVGFELT